MEMHRQSPLTNAEPIRDDAVSGTETWRRSMGSRCRHSPSLLDTIHTTRQHTTWCANNYCAVCRAPRGWPRSMPLAPSPRLLLVPPRSSSQSVRPSTNKHPQLYSTAI